MSKRVPVVLKQTVNKLGQNGELVEVAPGYARNYLIPQGLGVVATPGIIRQVEQRRAKEEARLAAEKAAAEARKVAFQTIGRLSIAKATGEGDAIFGTVTTQDIVDAIKAGTGQEVDRRSVTIPDIGKLGVYKAQVKLHPEVSAEVEFQVVAQ
ncbi:MAG: 50S ribosomal protein L9 [Cyanobacteria bacterium RI_101]|nr:50S ribosomal protein L9 [Cyanobacteria bacterium RI_101]